MTDDVTIMTPMKPLFCCYFITLFWKDTNMSKQYWNLLDTNNCLYKFLICRQETDKTIVCRTRAMRLLDNASKNKPFERCSIISFAKLDTTISTHSTNIRSAVQKSCCSCTVSITARSFTSLRFFARLGRFSLDPAGWLEVFALLVLPITIISVKRHPTLKEIRQNGKTVEF